METSPWRSLITVKITQATQVKPCLNGPIQPTQVSTAITLLHAKGEPMVAAIHRFRYPHHHITMVTCFLYHAVSSSPLLPVPIIAA